MAVQNAYALYDLRRNLVPNKSPIFILVVIVCCSRKCEDSLDTAIDIVLSSEKFSD
jgi:hypothetical protein